jgi:hypothetical protein
VRLSDFPQYNDGRFVITDDTLFVADIATIRTTAPYVSEALMQEHFEPLLQSVIKTESRVLERAFQRIENLIRVKLSYHPSPIPDEPTVVAFRMRVPASFCAHEYLVTVWCEIDSSVMTVGKPVTTILHARCQPTEEGGKVCRASGHGRVGRTYAVARGGVVTDGGEQTEEGEAFTLRYAHCTHIS